MTNKGTYCGPATPEMMWKECIRLQKELSDAGEIIKQLINMVYPDVYLNSDVVKRAQRFLDREGK